MAPRAQILDAAAELFVRQGLAATTTRQIADRVGIRQASLYYHFAGKDEILLELLTQSVRPSLLLAATLESRCRDDPASGTVRAGPDRRPDVTRPRTTSPPLI